MIPSDRTAFPPVAANLKIRSPPTSIVETSLHVWNRRSCLDPSFGGD